MTEAQGILLLIFSFVTIIVLCTAGLSHIKNIILQKERIRADALVKAEEIKAKNQLELEKLLRQDFSHRSDRLDDAQDSRIVRERKNNA